MIYPGELFKIALLEDLGPELRDISTEALGEDSNGDVIGEVKAKSEGIACGLIFIEPIVRELEQLLRIKSPNLSKTVVSLKINEGEKFSPGKILAVLKGPARTLLTAERTILNIIQRLSGIASLTHKFVQKIAHTKCRILDTRKTTPGMRFFEKYAVKIGGGQNHRFGLYDMVMLKDNHLTIAHANIIDAVKRVKELIGQNYKIEVEVSSFAQVREALKAGADIIMLDNMPLSTIKKCVKWVNGRVPLEASGGITLENVQEIAETGVDFISLGCLTHSAPSNDISLKIRLI